MKERTSLAAWERGAGGRSRAFAILLILGASLSGDPILAQTPPAGAAPPPTPNRFALTMSLGERFTSNPEFLPDPTSPGEKTPDGDYLSDMRLNLSMTRKTERTDWSLRYSPFYTRYRENGQLNTSNHAFDYNGIYTLSRRWRTILAEHFAYSRDPLAVASPEGGYDPVLTPDSKKWRSFSEAGVETDLSRSFTLQAALNGRVDRFQDPTLTDSETYTGRASLLKHLSRDQTLSVTYTYARFVLTEEGALGENVRLPDFSSHSLELGWARVAPGRAEFRLSGGTSQVFREGERQSLFTGSAIYNQPFRRADLTVGYRQNLSADTGVATVSVSQRAYAGLSARVGRFTTLSLTGDYGTRKSTLSEPPSPGAGTTYVDLSYAGVLLRGDVGITERISVTGDASRRLQRDATGARGDVMVNTVFVAMAFKIL